MKKILVLASGPLNYDSRPSLIAGTLIKAGYNVTLSRTIDGVYDAIHAVDMPALQLAIKNKNGAKIIYDALELWREDGTTMEINEDIAKPEWAKHVDMMFVDSVPSRNYILACVGNRIPIYIVHVTKPLQYAEYAKSDNAKFTLIFMGCISETRFLEESIEVVDEYDDVRLLIGGCIQGDDSYRRILRAIFNSKNTRFVGQVHFNKVIPMIRKADCVLNMVTPYNYNNASGLTNKQFEAMIAGRPIISSENTYSGNMTEHYAVGVVVPYTKDGLRDAINTLKNNKTKREYCGMNAFDIGHMRFNWEIESKRVVSAYSWLFGSEIHDKEKK